MNKANNRIGRKLNNFRVAVAELTKLVRGHCDKADQTDEGCFTRDDQVTESLGTMQR